MDTLIATAIISCIVMAIVTVLIKASTTTHSSNDWYKSY